MEDRELLDEFVEGGSQSAFRELVTRHLPVVYSAACRMVKRANRLPTDATLCSIIYWYPSGGLQLEPALPGYASVQGQTAAVLRLALHGIIKG